MLEEENVKKLTMIHGEVDSGNYQSQKPVHSDRSFSNVDVLVDKILANRYGRQKTRGSSPWKKISSIMLILFVVLAAIPFMLQPLYGGFESDISVVLDPDGVRLNETLSINMSIPSSYNINSVSVDMADVETISLSLVDNSSGLHLWSGVWFVHDITPDEHIMTIYAEDDENTSYRAGTRLSVLPEEILVEPEPDSNDTAPPTIDNATQNDTIPPVIDDTNVSENDTITPEGLKVSLLSDKDSYVVNEPVLISGVISFNHTFVNTSLDLLITGPGYNSSQNLNSTDGIYDYVFVPSVVCSYVVQVNVSYLNETALEEVMILVQDTTPPDVVPPDVSQPDTFELESQIEVGRPVIWKQRFQVEENLTVNISRYAYNISVGGIASEDDAVVIVGGISKNLHRFNIDKRKHVLAKGVSRWLSRVKRNPVNEQSKQELRRHYSELRDNVLPLERLDGTYEDIEQDIAQFIIEDAEVQLLISNISDEVEITYLTEGPDVEETELGGGRKRITVSSDIHYENILASTYLPMEAPSESVKLYHLTNGGRQEVSVDKFDLNNNSLIDYIEWIVPSLSNQTYEIDITIIDVQSYPTVGGNWTVRFNTTGAANLTISAINGTAFGVDLEFLELRCGNTTLTTELTDGVIFVENYSCDGIGYEISEVLYAGKHTLEFRFGDIVKYAYNNPGEALVEDTMYDVTDEYSPGPHAVFINDTHGYSFYQKTQGGRAECCYSKTTDGGTNWGSSVAIDAGTQYTFRSFSVWYDRWTPGNDDGTRIHIFAPSYDDNEAHYNYLDVTDDSTRGSWSATSAWSFNNAPDGGCVIVNSTDGNLFAVGFGNATGDAVDYFKSTDDGATWTFITPGYAEYNDDDDYAQIVPLSGGDILAVYHDTTGNTLYWDVYDEGTDTWSGSLTSIDTKTETGGYDALFGGSLYRSTGDFYLASNNQPNNGAGDIKAYKFSDSGRSWSTLTDILTNTAAWDVKIAVDQNVGDLYAIYSTSSGIYWKKSTDEGSSWSSATQISGIRVGCDIVSHNFMSTERIYGFYYEDSTNDLFGDTIADITPPAIPTVITNVSTGVEETNATLHGYLQYNGSTIYDVDTTCYFLLNDTNDFGSPIFNLSKGVVANNSDFSNDTVGETTLTQGKLYYFDTKANNSVGWNESGRVQMFLTKPESLSAFISTLNGATQIDLSWTDGTGGDGAYIEYASGSVVCGGWYSC